ncbi:O-antigen ligase family protein [Deinococcus pimensis]|uniref:O-antigen ligase family protein n=1 Tax=Deinococcus pimensis TaxID=309888 RepID=UPI0004B6895E|nr:O-antigen ligase family protein [Deinococcus pimensis]
MRARLSSALEVLALIVALLAVAWGPLAQGSTFWWGMAGLTLLGSTALALALVAASVRGRATVGQPLWVLAAVAFLGWIWASTTWAADTIEAQRWAGVWTCVIGTALALHLTATTRARQNAVLSVTLLTAGAAVVVGVMQARGVTVPGFQALDGTPEKYLTGPYFHPSHFSGYLIMPAALVSTILLCTRPGWHTLPLLALGAGVQVLNLHTDGSSIPAVMLAALLPLVVWAYTKRVWFGVLLTVLAVAGGLSVGWLLETPQGQAQFAAYKDRVGIKSQSLEGFLEIRHAIHYFPYQVWKAHPERGVGVAQFPTEFSPYRRAKNTVPGSVDQLFVNYAHSDYYQILAELGTPGLALFLLTLLTSVLRGARDVAALAWSSALLALAFTGFYDSHLTAIPGTMLAAFALGGVPSLPTRRARVLEQAPPPAVDAQPEAEPG